MLKHEGLNNGGMFKKLIWPFFIATALFQLLGSLFYFVILDNELAIQLVYTLTKILMFAAPVLFFYFGFKLPMPALKPELKKSLLFGIGSGLVISGLIFGTYFLLPSIFSSFAQPVMDKVVVIGIQNIYWIVAIGISVFHSFFEEYYWRWYVVRGLEVHFSSIKSILLGNLFFTFHHFIILSQFTSWPYVILFGTCVGIGGCLWSFLYKRTGSLLGSWLSHMIVDFAIFTIGYFLIT